MAKNSVAKESVLTSRTTIAAGLVFAALTLCFMMWMAIQVNQIQCSKAALVALVFGLGSALSTSFLGGYAAASGPVSIPYIGNHPINVALGGGILALVITTAMAWMVVRNNCSAEDEEIQRRLAECKVAPQNAHLGCVRVAGLGQPPALEGILNVRSGPDLICKANNSLVNDDEGEVLGTHGEWNYVKISSGQRAGVEGWVSVSFIVAIPCTTKTP